MTAVRTGEPMPMDRRKEKESTYGLIATGISDIGETTLFREQASMNGQMAESIQASGRKT